MSNKDHYPMKILCCTPSYFGVGGAPLNERQLIESLSNRVSVIYILNLFDLTLLHPSSRKTLCFRSSKSNIKLINIPLIPIIPERFVLLYTIRLVLYDIFLSLFAILLKCA